MGIKVEHLGQGGNWAIDLCLNMQLRSFNNEERIETSFPFVKAPAWFSEDDEGNDYLVRMIGYT